MNEHEQGDPTKDVSGIPARNPLVCAFIAAAGTVLTGELLLPSLNPSIAEFAIRNNSTYHLIIVLTTILAGQLAFNLRSRLNISK